MIPKKLLCALLLMIATCMAAMAQTAPTTTTHIVDRGETLATIATAYGVTPEQIIALNPEAEQFIYVGMELTIPASAASNNSMSNNMAQSTPGNPVAYSQGSEMPEEESDWTPLFNAGYGFLKGDKATINGVKYKRSGYTLTFTIGAAYKIYKSENINPYIGATIGYKLASWSEEYGNSSVDTNIHFITLPVEFGCKIGNKLALIPSVGFDFDFCVAANQKSGKEKQKLKKNFCMEFKPGLRLNIHGFDIGCYLHVPLSDDTKFAFGDDAYPELMIGWSF